jgi:hypothetical protein
VGAGIAETIRVIVSGDGGLVFWFGTLVGGGVLVLSGTLLQSSRTWPGFSLLAAGCALGMLPTMWTLVVPILLLALVFLSLRDAQEAMAAQSPSR